MYNLSQHIPRAFIKGSSSYAALVVLIALKAIWLPNMVGALV